MVTYTSQHTLTNEDKSGISDHASESGFFLQVSGIFLEKLTVAILVNSFLTSGVTAMFRPLLLPSSWGLWSVVSVRI
jgi:hypothetical protein